MGVKALTPSHNWNRIAVVASESKSSVDDGSEVLASSVSLEIAGGLGVRDCLCRRPNPVYGGGLAVASGASGR